MRVNLDSRLRLCLFGASPDTGNLGVSALCYSVIGGLARSSSDVDLTVFDEGRGLRRSAEGLNGQAFSFALCGATATRRLWQRRSLWNIRVSNWLGGLGNPAVARLRAADAVLDISGGDSFTDLYGPKRFVSVTASKRLALDAGRPLVLLPQTYGPYGDPACRAEAARIIRQAAMCWARDARSFETLKELLGDYFDPQRHQCGVDVAFALEARPPRAPLPEPVATWLAARGAEPAGAGPQASVAKSLNTSAPPLIGFNVNGLIWHDPAAMRLRYGFKADYRETVLAFLRRILRETDARILLVPHVLTPRGHYESDPHANEQVLAALRADPDPAVAREARQRLAAVPPAYTHPSEAKWLIGQLDWFCGTRMHACIAGLSSGIPTAAIAYSLKTQGVFETCGQGAAVVDPRVRDTAEVIAQLWDVHCRRDELRAALRPHVANNVRRAQDLMEIIIATARATSPVARQEGFA